METTNFTPSCDDTLTNAEWTAAHDIATVIIFSIFHSTQQPSVELIKEIAKILKARNAEG